MLFPTAAIGLVLLAASQLYSCSGGTAKQRKKAAPSFKTTSTSAVEPTANTQLCRGLDYLDGEWVFDPVHKTTRSFPCCSAKGEMSETTDPTTKHCLKHDKPYPIFLGNLTITEHSSKSHPSAYVTNSFNYIYHWGMYPRVMGNGCSCYNSYRAEGKPADYVAPMEQYRWQPKSCQMQAWSGVEFCKLLGSRTILLIGDSTMQQTAVTLMSMLISEDAQLSCATQVMFELSDYLVGPTVVVLSSCGHCCAVLCCAVLC
jgi:hypothetical protein